MGNQMFQYACAKNLELQHGFICSMDDLSKLEYFELAAGEHWRNKWKKKLFFHFGKRFFGMDVHNLEFDDMHKNYYSWLVNINKPSMIWGFFQSAEYFKQSTVQIKSYFKIKQAYQKDFNLFLTKHQLKKGNYNAVHLRRTDYKGFTVKGLEGDNFTLPASYYTKGIDKLAKELPLVIVSDDPSYCQQIYGNLANVIISNEDAITDFQLLGNASGLVISNSTFAWWAAWLNPFAKSIICPKYFLGFKEQKEVPLNIYPQGWNPILVN